MPTTLGSGRSRVQREAPDQDRAGSALDEAVDAEREEGDAAGGERGGDGDDALDDVPADGQVLEAQRTREVPGARARKSITTADTLVSATPTMLNSGRSRCHSVIAASKHT